MTNLYLEEQTKVVQSAGSVVSDMSGEKVMFCVDSGKYYNLGAIGGRVWELIASPIPVRKLVDELVSEYDVERFGMRGTGDRVSEEPAGGSADRGPER